MPYLGAQLREEGRLAMLAGKPQEAEAAWRHYLSLHREAEPAVQPEVEAVKVELAKLKQQ